MRYSEFKQYVTEGGNIFKDTTGEVTTTRINRSDIAPTIKWMEQITGLPLIDNTLGSVGKKESSGDLDIAVDQNAISKDDMVAKLAAWVTQQGEDPKAWIKKSGISVHFKTPINGDPANGFVQTDFMFGEDIEHMKFGLFAAGDVSKFSGADRNLLMSSIAKSLPGDFKYSWQKGLIKRSTSEVITKNPDEIAMVLLGKGHKGSDLESVESIMAAVSKDPTRLTQLKNSAAKLRDAEGKKPGEVKADTEEANRIESAMKAVK
jgi:hypothetical protein